jgi:hypothetical protein
MAFLKILNATAAFSSITQNRPHQKKMTKPPRNCGAGNFFLLNFSCF